MSPEQVVNAFCKALNEEGVEASLRYIADECVYQNMPFPPMHGPQGVRGDKITEWRDYFCMRQLAEGTGLLI